MADEIRSFIAVLISDDLKRRIAVVQEDFKKAAPDVKWVEEENFHITMKFLGDTRTDELDAIREAIEAAIGDLPPFAAEISGAGAFPNPRRPRTVWVGITSGVDQLAEIAKRIESALETIGFPKEDRPFKAHITIGRVKDDRGVGKLAGALQEAESVQLGTVNVASVAIMKSELRREGPIYSVLGEISLRTEAEGAKTNG